MSTVRNRSKNAETKKRIPVPAKRRAWEQIEYVEEFLRTIQPEEVTVINKGVWRILRGGIWKSVDSTTYLPTITQLFPRELQTAVNSHRISDLVSCLKRFDVTFGSGVRFDGGDVLVNCGNGVVRLKKIGNNGDRISLEKWNPDYHFTSKVAASYMPGSKCPLFKQVLGEQLPDEEDRELFGSFMGSCFWPTNKRWQVCLVLYGEGGTGKTTLCETVRNVLGDEGSCSNVSLHSICDHKGFELPRMTESLVNFGDEVNALDLIDSTNFKRILSGERISMREIYGKPFDSTVGSKLVFTCNQLPKFKHGTDAERRRLRIIHCPNKLRYKEKVHGELKNEINGIFEFLLHQYLILIDRGEMPQGGELSRKLLEQFGVNNDPLKACVSTTFDFVPDEFIPVMTFWNIYEKFLIEHDLEHLIQPGGSHVYGRNLRTRFPQVTKKAIRINGKVVSCYTGICVRNGKRRHGL